MELKRIDEVKIEDFDIPKVTLKQVIDKMKWLTDRGFSCYLSGKGDGSVTFNFIRTKKMSVKKR